MRSRRPPLELSLSPAHSELRPRGLSTCESGARSSVLVKAPQRRREGQAVEACSHGGAHRARESPRPAQDLAVVLGWQGGQAA